ncbi:MAG: hypothetical protein JXA16_03465, partial [Bacteroidales bacterium]|nr:hypothetical protein [Bacteroidales bacterium]
IEFSLFYNYISDLILWQPVFNIWTPINLKENLARGIELNMSGLAKNSMFQIHYKASYSYTKSTIEKIAENESENLLHNQLAYVPFHNVSTNVSVSYKRISLSFISNFVGKRYTDASNLRELDAYFIGNVNFSYNIEASKFKINTFFKIDNIWNTNYQSVYLYPNPLRSYEIGFSLNFRKDS